MKDMLQALLSQLVEQANGCAAVPQKSDNCTPANGPAESCSDGTAKAPGDKNRSTDACGKISAPDSKIVGEIASVFETLQNQTEQLGNDLLRCYEQMNGAFDAITAVAQCTHLPQAVETLLRQIGLAVNSRYSYFIGRIAGGPFDHRKTSHSPQLLRVPCESRKEGDSDFWDMHQDKLLALISLDRDCEVSTIDFQGEYELDHEGRGNVLLLRLIGGDKSGELSGNLLFVRGDDQDLFAAVDMNLAASLVKMGSAVVDRIIYSDKLSQTFLQTLTTLIRTIEAKDAYTSGHSTRVAEIARRLGRDIGLEDRQVQWLEWAGLLHDIGKIGISEQIICKPGRLTDEEFEQIKLHPTKSYDVLEPIEAMRPVLAAIKHHHERFDGSGYPDHLAREDIPLAARVLQIADVWDALTSTRSYRKALGREKALEIMRSEAGTVLDPNLFKHFEQLLSSGKLPWENPQ